MASTNPLKPRIPSFPSDRTRLPTRKYQLPHSFELDISRNKVGDFWINGVLFAPMRNGEQRIYLFEGRQKNAKLAVTVSVADPSNRGPFFARGGGQVHTLTGLPMGARRDLKERAHRTSQFAIDSWLAEQNFLQVHYEQSQTILGSSKSHDSQTTLEIRSHLDWIIDRSEWLGVVAFSARHSQDDPNGEKALQRLQKNAEPPRY